MKKKIQNNNFFCFKRKKEVPSVETIEECVKKHVARHLKVWKSSYQGMESQRERSTLGNGAKNHPSMTQEKMKNFLLGLEDRNVSLLHLPKKCVESMFIMPESRLANPLL